MPAGEFPPGWQAWLDAMQAHPGRVRGAAAEDIVARLAAREPRPLPPGEVLENRWQVFTVLWRQHWEPAPDDERGTRRLSGAVSGVLHLVGLFLLGWLMIVPPWAGPTQAGDDSVIEVTWIGEGTPRDEGAGPPSSTDADRSDEQQASSASPAPPVASPERAAAISAQELPPPTPQPEPQPAVAEQPLVVTETPTPDTTFVVPPPPEVPVLQPTLRERTVALRDREIPVQDPVELAQPALPALRPVEVDAAPRIEQPVVELAEREVVVPVRRPEAPRITAPSVQAPVVERDAQPAPVRDIALREPSPGQGSASADAAASGPSSSAIASTGATPSSDAGTRPDATAAGAGATASPAPGAIPSLRPGDDWDTAAQDRPGGQAGTAGLFNRDGRPQLPPGAGRVGGGLPPGTITEDYEKIDRMGTWLRRPPSGFEPTSLDRFWVPHENLLEEWVRRSIRTVLIPIPGSSKSIRCDVALLAFGGGCGITDPNMQDVEAGARPPPDIPWKPELQEGDDAR
ncbi:hypothetical protein CO641_07460 [Lysobacteraceae bacterium NML91-0213]|nr:hypothetical protein CO641_07460 [Xanthomonadaceae bacterium NML91-0213]